ncbi:hypothetical protein N7535_008489 [Penicillium sp. DV-2018c]|nr:hypothetical protein N7535_008489 [Penicillium sp. DV-2018c]
MDEGPEISMDLPPGYTPPRNPLHGPYTILEDVSQPMAAAASMMDYKMRVSFPVVQLSGIRHPTQHLLQSPLHATLLRPYKSGNTSHATFPSPGNGPQDGRLPFPWYNFPGYDVNNLFYNPLSMPPNYAPTMEDHFPAEGGSSLGGGPQPPSTFHGHPQESREGTPEDQEEENDEAGDDQED